MKCKVFDCAISNLEGQVGAWIAATSGLNIMEVAPLGIDHGKTSVLIFYKESMKVVQPDVPEEEFPKCPDCGRSMRVRANSTSGSLFFGCPAYPGCKGTKQFTPEDEVLFGGALPPTGPPSGSSSGLPPDDDDIPF